MQRQNLSANQNTPYIAATNARATLTSPVPAITFRGITTDEHELLYKIATEPDWNQHWFALYKTNPSAKCLKYILETMQNEELRELAAYALTVKVFDRHGNAKVLGDKLTQEDKETLYFIMENMPQLTYTILERWGKDFITTMEIFEMLLKLPHFKDKGLAMLKGRQLDSTEQNYLDTYIIPRISLPAGKAQGL